MFPPLGANNCTVFCFSSTVCQEKINSTLFSICYTVFLANIFLKILIFAVNPFLPFQEKWKLRQMFSLCGVTESKSLTSGINLNAKQSFPQNYLFLGKRIILYSESATTGCSHNYFILKNTVSWNIGNQCKILMFVSGTGEL